jgi:peptide/nickel transport system permease protein
VGVYLVRRFLLMILTLVGISMIIFVLLRVVPGNIVDILFDSAGMVNPAEKLKIEKELGLDKPIPLQYLAWIGGIAQGDLGYSYVSEKSTVDEIAPRIPVTAKLAVLALLFSIVLGVPLGVISAVKQNSATDYALRVLSLTGLSMPPFWLALLILMVFVAQFGSMPIYTAAARGFWDDVLLYSIPAMAVGFRSSALIMRLTRSSMLEVLRQDYIRTARAKGVADPPVVWKHALKNAAIPIVTIVGIELGTLLGGAVITETIFAWPGVGRLSVQAIYNRDYPVVQAAVFLLASTFVLVNLVVDVAYTYLDPRIRLQ